MRYQTAPCPALDRLSAPDTRVRGRESYAVGSRGVNETPAVPPGTASGPSEGMRERQRGRLPHIPLHRVRGLQQRRLVGGSHLVALEWIEVPLFQGQVPAAPQIAPLQAIA